MTNKEMLQGMFNFPIADEIVNCVLYLREVYPDDEFDMEEQTLDLCLADVLMVLSRASQGYSQQTGSDAFSMSVRGEYIPLADRKSMRAEANAIYKSYGEEKNIRPMNAINVYKK